MEKILTIRQRLKELYEKYDIYVIPVLKFLAAFVTLIVIKNTTGYSDFFSQWNVIAIIALICAMIPWPAITFVSSLVLIINLFELSWEIAVVAIAFILVAAIAQYLFLPGMSIIIALIPVAFYFNVPFLIPLIVGLVGKSTAFIPAGMGTFAYYFLVGVQKNSTFFMDQVSNASVDIMSRFTQVLSIIKDNNLMLLSILAVCVTVLITYAIRHLSFDFAPYIAVGFGVIGNILVYLVGAFLMDVTVPYVSVFVGDAISLVLAILIALWIIVADYNHSEYLQYEDDDYLYYVKAVPKVKMAAKKVKVSEITSDEDQDIKDALKALDEIDEEERRSGK